MVELILPPDPHALLPPLLAFLPTAFASSRPPPGLLPFLSPILRQRLQLLTSSASSHDNWLRLLCWDGAKAETLKETIENANFEPHPSSGEIEVGEVDPITYKRFDNETLRAQIGLPDWSFTVLYLWCTGGDEGSGWKLAELIPYVDALQKDHTWLSTVEQANETSKERLVSEALLAAQEPSRRPSVAGDDDDYWAQYDSSPGNRTPAHKTSTALHTGQSDADYYAQYGQVQPAMDNHDPSEEMPDVEGSSLNGNALHEMLSGRSEQPRESQSAPYSEPVARIDDPDGAEVSQPIASSPSSRGGSDTVARLEQSAERYGTSEIGVRQHISTSMKSMYRLAKSSGMDREEFERIVQRELETLSFLD